MRPLRNPTASKNTYRSLYNTMRLSMILVPIIIYILALGIGYIYFANSIQNSSIARLKRVVIDHGHMIDSFLSERRADLEFVSQIFSFDDLNDERTLSIVLKTLRLKSTAFIDLGIFNEDGLHVAYSGPYDLSGKSYSNEIWYQAVLTRGVFISDVFQGFRQIPHFVIAILKVEKNQRWVIRATVDPHFFSTLVEQVKIGKTGEAFIVNQAGLLQTRRQNGMSLMEFDPTIGAPLAHHDGINVSMATDITRQKIIRATTWLENKSWMLMVTQERSDAFQLLNDAIYLIGLITVSGIGIITLFSFYFTTLLMRRLKVIDAEKEKLRFQLIHASGLAELGEMATGFAHEINNPLQIIRNEVVLIQMNMVDLLTQMTGNKPDIVGELDDSLEQIEIQIDRCATITQSILKFGRKNEPVSDRIDLNSFIPETISLIENRAMIHSINIDFQSGETPCWISGDPSQLQQVFLNLLNNAIDAVCDRYGHMGGRIDIKISQPGGQITEVLVSDNGVGISASNQLRVFSPFFTTKPVGKGTGLGLSVCYGIIKNMGGEMEVSSQLNAGTTFKLRLLSENLSGTGH